MYKCYGKRYQGNYLGRVSGFHQHKISQTIIRERKKCITEEKEEL